MSRHLRSDHKMHPRANHPDPVIRDLEIMAIADNYQRWMYSQFQRYLGQRIVECGAGIGNITRLLLNRELVIALDIHQPCLEQLRLNVSHARNVIALEMDLESAALSELAKYQPDTIVCINVLEHIRDDNATLARMFKLLSPEGRLIILVPAFQALYGSIDRRLEHYRRYSKPGLSRQITQAGFSLNDIFYMNSVATVGWFLNNRVFHRTDHSPFQVTLFDRWIVPWLRHVERVFRPPFGLSLIAIGEKGRE